MVKQNLGNLDRIFRFVLGVWWLSPWAPLFQWEWANWVILIVGVIALIESFIGVCWMHNVLHIHNK
jgi:hypothetical protein